MVTPLAGGADTTELREALSDLLGCASQVEAAEIAEPAYRPDKDGNGFEHGDMTLRVRPKDMTALTASIKRAANTLKRTA